MAGCKKSVNRATRAVAARMFVGVFAVMAMFGLGCKRSQTVTHPAAVPTTVVEIVAVDIKPDGSIKPSGLDKIRAKADAAHVTVAFARVPVGDLALAQLAQFANIKRIEARGSRMTAAGVAAFNQTAPGIDVSY